MVLAASERGACLRFPVVGFVGIPASRAGTSARASQPRRRSRPSIAVRGFWLSSTERAGRLQEVLLRARPLAARRKVATGGQNTTGFGLLVAPSIGSLHQKLQPALEWRYSRCGKVCWALEERRRLMLPSLLQWRNIPWMKISSRSRFGSRVDDAPLVGSPVARATHALGQGIDGHHNPMPLSLAGQRGWAATRVPRRCPMNCSLSHKAVARLHGGRILLVALDRAPRPGGDFCEWQRRSERAHAVRLNPSCSAQSARRRPEPMSSYRRVNPMPSADRACCCVEDLRRVVAHACVPSDANTRTLTRPRTVTMKQFSCPTPGKSAPCENHPAE